MSLCQESGYECSEVLGIISVSLFWFHHLTHIRQWVDWKVASLMLADQFDWRDQKTYTTPGDHARIHNYPLTLFHSQTFLVPLTSVLGRLGIHHCQDVHKPSDLFITIYRLVFIRIEILQQFKTRLEVRQLRIKIELLLATKNWQPESFMSIDKSVPGIWHAMPLCFHLSKFNLEIFSVPFLCLWVVTIWRVECSIGENWTVTINHLTVDINRSWAKLISHFQTICQERDREWWSAGQSL